MGVIATSLNRTCFTHGPGFTALVQSDLGFAALIIDADSLISA